MKKVANLFSLENRVALVTGGRRGIGKAIVLMLAEAGANIVVCDYADENNELAKLTGAVEKLGRRCLVLKADVSKSQDVEAMAQKTLDAYGKIDVLVNNAGISPATPPIPELKETDWDAVIDINLKGTYLCCKAVSRPMAERKTGSIINIASVEGLGTVRRASSPYGASKAGIIMLTRGLAWDLGKYNVRVNAIAPGAIKTDMTRYTWDPGTETFRQIMEQFAATLGPAAPGDLDELQRLYWAQYVPMARMAQPEEIAAGALYLASDAASYVNGHTLLIDGGWLA